MTVTTEAPAVSARIVVPGPQGPPGPPGAPAVLNDLTDVDTVTRPPAAIGEVLLWDGVGNWIPGPVAVPGVGETFVQAAAATTWTIDHTLPFKPNVTVMVDLGAGLESVTAGITYPSATQVVVTLSIAYAGEAYLS